MASTFPLKLDRSAKATLAEQIHKGIVTAIESGVLAPGARLPSWLDLAAQLGVARGTVRLAYDRLGDEQLITASRAQGTRVADRPPVVIVEEAPPDLSSFMGRYQEMMAGPAIFQMGIPSQESLPAKLFSRTRSYAARAEFSRRALYPDPCGEIELRREIAAYLAIARGIQCLPSQIIITAGYSAGLGLALRVLGLHDQKVWIEDPSFAVTRHGLELAGLRLEPIPVDKDGIDVEYGLKRAPDAALVVLTPGQQAPLGCTLSLARRLGILEWAVQEGKWIIEDDYLSELQLGTRAAPALASLDHLSGRVIHIGSFSKTITPTLRLGFIVAPRPLVALFAETSACLAPAPMPAVQLATAEFMREGHYLRHLRRTKRLYSAQQDALLNYLLAYDRNMNIEIAGLAMLLRLPKHTNDVFLAKEARTLGMAPSPLSIWYHSPMAAQVGLLLGISTAPQQHISQYCDLLLEVIHRFTSNN